YHRLSVILIKVPPLRERADDIAELVEHFIRQIAAEQRIATKSVDADAMATLRTMPWSGNIRELRNVVERLMILSGKSVTAEDVRMYC
ncbi:MAG: sigma-54-dependent Fis family transcriptional regulator, partial [Alistipes sp.]|nr:sigma-54-dependent Fis family transcriptional regulator [Alistipes sp.]